MAIFHLWYFQMSSFETFRQSNKTSFGWGKSFRLCTHILIAMHGLDEESEERKEAIPFLLLLLIFCKSGWIYMALFDIFLQQTTDVFVIISTSKNTSSHPISFIFISSNYQKIKSAIEYNPSNGVPKWYQQFVYNF